MPTIQLTDITIRALKPPEAGQETYFDKTLSGFGVRVSAGGTKTFVLVHGPTRRRTTIGRYPTIGLSEARGQARHVLAEETLGKTRLATITFQDAQQRYLEECEQRTRPRTTKDYRRLLNRHFRFGRTHLADITAQDIHRRLEKLASTPAERKYAFVALRAFLRWAVRMSLLEQSPIHAARQPGSSTSRDRVLADDELGTVFRAALAYPYPFGPIVSLLILTGQRRGEIAALEWEWIEEDHRLITLPPSLTKNGRAHTFPYGERAAAIFAALPRTSPYIFPARTATARHRPTTIYNGWSKDKAAFDKTVPGVDPYTLHDLRRTVSTHMADLGVRQEVTEKLLNHITGKVSGIAAVYNRHTYLDEMRQAMVLYEAHLAELLDI